MAQKITVVNTNTSSSEVFENCEATNLGELKALCSSKGIDYTGCTFYEASHKVELKQDDSLLPTATTAKGLMFMITKSNKNISSGAMTRKEAVAFLEKNNLKETLKQETGKNWTNVSNDVLLAFVAKHSSTPKAEPKAEPKEAEKTAEKTEQAPDSAPADNNVIVKAILYLAEKANCKEEITSILSTGSIPSSDTYSPEEIKKMMAETMGIYKK